MELILDRPKGLIPFSSFWAIYFVAEYDYLYTAQSGFRTGNTRRGLPISLTVGNNDHRLRVTGLTVGNMNPTVRYQS
jgi:hypothetical protein